MPSYTPERVVRKKTRSEFMTLGANFWSSSLTIIDINSSSLTRVENEWVETRNWTWPEIPHRARFMIAWRLFLGEEIQE